MQHLESYQRPAFLKDHPPVMQTMILAGTGSEATYLAGTVLGRDSDGKLVPWTTASAGVEGILASDVTVSASGGMPADVYVHASVVARELIFADGVSDADKQTALAALRARGIYA